jgi:hypothetical protein
MPGPLLHFGATVLCSHGGQAMPSAPNLRVLVSGQPVATMPAPYLIAGCAFAPPAGNGPCVTAQWVVAATRVLIGGQPAVLLDSQATCIPTGTPLMAVASQTRVTGS